MNTRTDVETLSIHHAPPGAQALVPSGFAEKAMASLMQLHGELVEEKERRVELFRRLMEKEQVIAELRMQLRLVEEQGGVSDPAPRVAIPRPISQAPMPRPQPAAPPPQRVRAPASPVSAPARAQLEGWKVW
jgi:hypothetical protein